MLWTSHLLSCKEGSKFKRYGYLTAATAQLISVIVFACNNYVFMLLVATIALSGWCRGVYNYWIKDTKSS